MELSNKIILDEMNYEKNDKKNKKKINKNEKIEKENETKKINNKESCKLYNVFSYILLVLFTIFVIMLISCMFFVNSFSKIGNSNNQNSVSVRATKLNKDFKYKLINGKDIFNQSENEYYVLLYRKDSNKSKYYFYINQYSKLDNKFYFVDLNDKNNSFLFKSNDLNFTVNSDRLLKVKDKEYVYFVNGKNNILNEMKKDIDELYKIQNQKK